VLKLASFLLVFFLADLAGEAVASEQAVDAPGKRVTLSLPAEPPSLNSLQASDDVSFFILSHLVDGLLQYGPDQQLAPAIAERWEVRRGGATFWLRQNARWSDGQPVTAHDFVFAWRQVVNPANAARYASLFYPIRNARAIHNGRMDTTALGVKAVDDHTLEVSFEKPCPYFAALTAFMSYFPVREEFYNRPSTTEKGYGASPETLLTNGPYKLMAWQHGASLLLRKNPDYWNASGITIEEINIPYITADNSAVFNLFRNGNIALANLDASGVKVALREKYQLKKLLTGTLFFLQFNLREKSITADATLRRAIQAVVDTDYLVNRVVALPGIKASASLYPGPITMGGKPLQNLVPAYSRKVNVASEVADVRQRQLELRLLISDVPVANRIAEYLQQVLKEELNIRLLIEKQGFKQRLQRMVKGDFELALSSWGPDYNDPLTFADLFASWNANNRGRYINTEYDGMVSLAQSSTDQAERIRAFGKLQQLLYEDAAIIPLYENAELYVQHPGITGIVRSVFGGDPNFRYAGFSGQSAP
jgi:oligopeptide transport system substrate-binding protein